MNADQQFNRGAGLVPPSLASEHSRAGVTGSVMRDRSVADHEPHKLGCVGSIPAPATTLHGVSLSASGSGHSGKEVCAPSDGCSRAEGGFKTVGVLDVLPPGTVLPVVPPLTAAHFRSSAIGYARLARDPLSSLREVNVYRRAAKLMLAQYRHMRERGEA